MTGAQRSIKLSEIRHYCDLYEITNLEQKDRIIRFVQAIDQSYLAHVNKPAKK